MAARRAKRVSSPTYAGLHRAQLLRREMRKAGHGPVMRGYRTAGDRPAGAWAACTSCRARVRWVDEASSPQMVPKCMVSKASAS